MRKILIKLLVLLFSVCLSCTLFFACGGSGCGCPGEDPAANENPAPEEDGEEPPAEDPTSQGLIYALINGGTEYEVASIGTCTDTDIVIPSTYEDKPVTSIGNFAFYDCTNLQSIEIPDSVTSIGIQALYSCSGLQSVTIPNSVESVGNLAFYDCSSLQYNTEGNLKYLGNDTNQYLYLADTTADDITTATVNSDCKIIGYSAFSDCDSLESISIPNGVISVGNGAFSGCSSLQYNTEGNLKYLGNDTNNYLYLAGVTSTDITQATINPNCKIIGNQALFNCKFLTIEIPNSITTIGENAFLLCFRLQSVNIPNSVTSIGDSAFSSCGSLQSVTISNSVTSIGDYAFSGCNNLQSIEIPNGVVSIGEGAFSDCDSLESITVDANNPVYKSEGNCIIEKATNTLISGCITSVIPDYVTSIGDSAFHGCRSLQSIQIPSSVTSIGDSAFYNCDYLQSIEIPNSVTTISYHAFSNCESLESINIPNGVVSIGESAFSYCDSLESITVDANNPVYKSEGNCIIEKETNKLISGCKTSVIPDYVTAIGDYAFDGCESLQSIQIPSSVTSIGINAFLACSSLQSIEIPNGVEIISAGTFLACSSLQSIEIPNGVEIISLSAFSGCDSLESITIPNSVEIISIAAFRYCTSLQSITYNGTMAEWQGVSKDLFWNDGVPATCVVHCTDGDVAI